MKKKKSIANTIWIVILTIAALAWIYPIIMILMNSLKKESAISTGTAFKLPTADAFAGIANYVDAVASKGFLSSLGYSTFITITSVVAILVCCSMCAWYITRVNSPISKILYYLFVFSMVVPFQMVMFTLSQTADTLHLNMPWNIWVIYLGFGAGLAVFMFCGFVKSVGILEAMCVWNDYLLPTLVLDIKKYKTIPMLIQYFRGSYGRVEMGPMMASIMLTVIPIIIVYLAGQKYIIKGVAAGAVKG